MVDSIRVLSPTDRITDASGVPVPGAKLFFFQAGTNTPQTVYADKGLSVALGVTVYCDSGGYPVTTNGGSTKTPIWIGALNYKVEITDAGNVDVFPPLDNLDGALSTSSFGAAWKYLAKSIDYTVQTTDDDTLIEFDTTSATRTATLPNAVTAGTGWLIGFRKKVSANSLTINTVSSQTIRSATQTGLTTVSLTNTDIYWLQSDGANWITMSQYGALGIADAATGTKIAAALVPDMKAASSAILAVTPARQHFHPGHPKAWLYSTVSGGVPTLVTSYNVTSITDTATGRLTATLTAAFSSANYALVPGVEMASGTDLTAGVNSASRASGSFEITAKTATSLTDPVAWSAVALGDL